MNKDNRDYIYLSIFMIFFSIFIIVLLTIMSLFIVGHNRGKLTDLVASNKNIVKNLKMSLKENQRRRFVLSDNYADLSCVAGSINNLMFYAADLKNLNLITCIVQSYIGVGDHIVIRYDLNGTDYSIKLIVQSVVFNLLSIGSIVTLEVKLDS